MITVHEAKGLVGAHAQRPTDRTCALAQAEGLILAEPLVADRHGPPFDRVAMDGIAISFEAWRQGQRIFMCEGMQAAGSPRRQLADPSHCLEAMTGAMLPLGCDGVVPFERCRREGQRYCIDEDFAFKAFLNIHREAEDYSRGDVVIPGGVALNPARIAVAATLGYAEVKVQAAPKIAWVTTGSELVDVEATPLDHQIRKSNLHAGLAACRARGYGHLSSHHIPDDQERTVEALGQLLQNQDVLILSGGVSKGKLDFVPGALETLGVKKVFHRVAQKPGKPMWFGVHGQTRVFGLPGNPASMLVCLERFVLPSLDAERGLEQIGMFLPCLGTPPSRPSMTLFKTCRVVGGEMGSRLEFCRDHGSGDVATLARGDGFAEIPPSKDGYYEGSVFRFWPWSS